MAPRARRQPPVAPATPPPSDTIAIADDVASSTPRFERIEQRAYAIYERRGGHDGSAVDDWLQAEREIDSEK